ncbi:hypothetical protein D3C87_1923020 [compost metagenome]
MHLELFLNGIARLDGEKAHRDAIFAAVVFDLEDQRRVKRQGFAEVMLAMK